MYLILAAVWLIFGAGLLTYQFATGDHILSFHFGGTPVSSGWFMLILAAYNFVRWYSRRSMTRRHGAQRMAESRRQQVRRIDETRERDPNFVFTDEPPPVRRTDYPPSQN